jgi:hypothetical protein
VALLAAEGLDGCEVHVLFSAAEGHPAEMYQQSRGWSADDWAGAVERLRARGLLDDGGRLTATGAASREHVERRTDELAIAPYAALGDAGVEELLAHLAPAAERVAASGEIRYPNPMNLPSAARP